MLPERHVWVFNGTGGQLPGGVFSTRAAAEVWIRARRLTGVLTAYPLDEGALDWVLRTGLASERLRVRAAEGNPAFVGSFSSALQEHFHYESGRPGGAAGGAEGAALA